MAAERPLSGRRIVVTRAQAQAAPLRALLEADGAEVIEFPTIRLTPPADYGPLDRAIARLAEYRWIVFTSPNGVAGFVKRMRALGQDPLLIAHAGVAAIGPGTAQALRTQGLRADPPEARRRLLQGGQVDAVTFTSSSTVRNFVALLGRDGTRALRGSLVACIGPVTAATAREHGLRVGVVAETYTIPGLVAALRSALRGG
jgi:uroporphyrinogen III methyltransferase/synthase